MLLLLRSNLCLQVFDCLVSAPYLVIKIIYLLQQSWLISRHRAQGLRCLWPLLAGPQIPLRSFEVPFEALDGLNTLLLGLNQGIFEWIVQHLHGSFGIETILEISVCICSLATGEATGSRVRGWLFHVIRQRSLLLLDQSSAFPLVGLAGCRLRRRETVQGVTGRCTKLGADLVFLLQHIIYKLIIIKYNNE